jgi:putative hemolysin
MLWWAIDIIAVFILILVNGIFSMSEISIIAARKARLQQRAEEGDSRARTALDLSASPNMFLSTVQVGITLVGVLSGAIGGATIADKLSSQLALSPIIAPYSSEIALAVVVFCITFFSLVIGELVPKRIALNNPERIACLSATPMRLLSKISAPVVSLLSASTNLVLRLIRVRPPAEPFVTEEELRVLIDQATEAGVIEESEQDMVERVFRLADRPVGALMTPRRKIVWLEVNDSPETIRRKIRKSRHSRFPVCHERLRNLIGFVHVRDLFNNILAKQPFNLKASARHPQFVFEDTRVLKVMELFQESGLQVALVVDEYGTVEGLITINDILESIVGDLRSYGEAEEPKIAVRPDGSWLVDGMLPLDELKEYFDIKTLPEEEEVYVNTLGGLVMTHLKRIPSPGDRFECCGLRFEVLDMDGKRVDKVLIERAPVGNNEPHP